MPTPDWILEARRCAAQGEMTRALNLLARYGGASLQRVPKKDLASVKRVAVQIKHGAPSLEAEADRIIYALDGRIARLELEKERATARQVRVREAQRRAAERVRMKNRRLTPRQRAQRLRLARQNFLSDALEGRRLARGVARVEADIARAEVNVKSKYLRSSAAAGMPSLVQSRDDLRSKLERWESVVQTLSAHLQDATLEEWQSACGVGEGGQFSVRVSFNGSSPDEVVELMLSAHAGLLLPESAALVLRSAHVEPELLPFDMPLDRAVAAKQDLTAVGFKVTLREGASTSATPCGRKPIPERVRREVWRRDSGRCVDCGSRERLEFDHIIPVSKGGANTARNLELRCEPCNRRKAATI